MLNSKVLGWYMKKVNKVTIKMINAPFDSDEELQQELFIFVREISNHYYERSRLGMKKRGTFGLIVDFILTMMTGGLWLIWILIRYLRNH